MESFRPNLILAGPSGSRAFLIMGALKRLYEEKLLINENNEGNNEENFENYLSKVNKWVGVSSGAAISLLIVCGYSVDEIINLCLHMNIIEDIININLNEAKEKLGLLRNQTVEEKMKECIIKKFGYVPTLKQLYELTNLYICLVTFNLDKLRPEYLDWITEPDLSCLEAAMMSMAVPILMQPRKYKGYLYVDGGISAPFPVLKFDQDGNKILGLYVTSEEDLYCSDKKIINFLYRLIHSSMKALRDLNIEMASQNVKHIALKTDFRDTTGLMIDEKGRQQMIENGYNLADSFLKLTLHPEKYVIISENEEIPF